ncbi:MAG: hypothetical protein WA136_11290 [Rhodoferax sp.]
MNRCYRLPPLRRTAAHAALCLSLAAGLASLCAPALAQQQLLTIRPFPATALRGTLQVTNPPDVLLDGKAARLAPGARIRGTNNMLVMSGAIVGESVLVNYVREPLGLIHDVWILNAAEARLPLPSAP